MKKVLALVVAFALCFTMFAGCFATSAADAAFTVSGSTVTSDGGAATITIAGNYASKTVQLLTVTIPDGLSFDSVTDMDPYVEGSEEDFGYVASTNADTGVTTVKFLEAYTGDFSIVINVTADANTTDADVTYTIDASADVADWDATEVTSVQTTGSITVPAKKAEHTCDFSGELQYKVEDGNCITYQTCTDETCGAVNTIATVANKTLAHAPLLESDLSIKFRIKQSDTTGYTNVYAVFNKEGFDNDATTDTIVGADVVVNNTARWEFEYKGIASTQMNNKIDVNVFGTDTNGNVVLLASEDYSMVEYIKTQYNTVDTYLTNTPNGNFAATYTKLRVLLVDLANYGAAAQTYKNYNIDNLANKEIPQDYASETITEFEDALGDTATGVKFYRAPDLGNKVLLQIRFDKADVASYGENLVLKISYYDTNDNLKHDVISYADFDSYTTSSKVERWQITFDKLEAAAMSSVFTVGLYNTAETDVETLESMQTIGYFEYSIESYAYTAKANSSVPAYAAVLPLAEQLMTYSASAKAYLTR